MTVIAVAISGGVDSLVAAFLLKQQGYDIVGIHFRTGYEANRSKSIGSAPPKPADIGAIERQLKIPVEILDIAETFRQTVVAYFTATYQAGRTPNPCLFCNPTIKFGHILSHVQQQGADALATGHYARVKTGPDERRHLYRGLDARKDQSYFLSRLSQDQLRNARFPLGELTKDEVRAIARRNHLTPTTHQESQDICFIRETPYHVFLQHQAGFQIQEGLIEDTQGRVIGRHRGLHLFTIGQRRGIDCPAAEPYYVVRLDHARNCLIVGPRQELARHTCTVGDINWIHSPACFPVDVHAQIRYRHKGAPAHLTRTSKTTVELKFEAPQDAITPGQGAVFYKNEEVLGGGWIV
jgi:tRNA-uridine 2-sulfurtransferase